MDVRKLYIKQLLQSYKNYKLPTRIYAVNFQTKTDVKEKRILFEHNEGIDLVIKYVEELENKIDELQYIEKIVEAAKEKAAKEIKNDRQRKTC